MGSPLVINGQAIVAPALKHPSRGAGAVAQEPFGRDFLERTKGVWEPYAGKPLTDEDAREIAETMLSLFDPLDQSGGENGRE